MAQDLQPSRTLRSRPHLQILRTMAAGLALF